MNLNWPLEPTFDMHSLKWPLEGAQFLEHCPHVNTVLLCMFILFFDNRLAPCYCLHETIFSKRKTSRSLFNFDNNNHYLQTSDWPSFLYF